MIEQRIPLLNAVANEIRDFGQDFVVRPVTQEEQARWKADPHVRDVVPHRVLPEIRYVLVARDARIGTEEQKHFEEDLGVWFGAAALYTGREVEIAFCEEWLRQDSDPDDGGTPRYQTVTHFPLRLPVTGAPSYMGPVILDPASNGIKEALQKFRSDHPYVGPFRFALSRWSYSLNKYRRTLEDAVLDLAIALEAVFVPERNGDKAKAIRERVSRFWCCEISGEKEYPQRLRDIKNKLCKIYDVRSCIIHGAIVEESRLSEARSAIDQIMRNLLCDFIAGNLDAFNPLTYWQPLASEPCKASENQKLSGA